MSSWSLLLLGPLPSTNCCCWTRPLLLLLLAPPLTNSCCCTTFSLTFSESSFLLIHGALKTKSSAGVQLFSGQVQFTSDSYKHNILYSFNHLYGHLGSGPAVSKTWLLTTNSGQTDGINSVLNGYVLSGDFYPE